MQQGGGSHSRYAPESSAPPLPAAASHHHHGMVVEEASPISSRPPAPENIEQLMPEIDAFVAEDAERGGGGGGGGGGNRWPRQETVALLKIRSDMDAVFRDASLKGPLWEDVSRKMSELGYKRSAKKCKEKFENVHKYYKRTKEGRAGRQDGKTYKFFTELEALQTAIPSGSALPLPHQPALAPPPVAVSIQPPPVSLGAQFGNLNMPVAPPSMTIPGMQPPIVSHVFPVTSAAAPPGSSPLGLIFSSNSSSLSPGSGDDEDDEEDVEGEPSTAGSSRKRKRAAETPSSVSEGRRMMEYFEGLMKRVMQKQEEMQKRFLEAIEKREQDRLAREEAWRRQEMYRLAREHDLMAQERAVSASRDAAIMSFLQKITGQTIQLPTTVPVVSPRAPPPPQAPAAAAPPPSRTQPQQQPPLPPQPPQTYQPSPLVSQEIIAAIPEQQIPPPPQEIIGTSGGGEVPSPSRWPKAEVLALIRLRSGMETKYQEAGPKGPLWEEISAGMHRLGYKRNPKRCKEKWENINKYFKKVKESNKKRPEDAKTCPYFHELDALYRKKVLIGQTSGGGIEIRSDAPTNVAAAADAEQPKNGGPEEEETESTEKPEDTVKEMMNHPSEQQQSRGVDLGDKADEADDENLDQDENEEELDEDEDEEMEEERKMAYKIEYQQQRQNAGTPNGSGNGSVPPFVTMVQ